MATETEPAAMLTASTPSPPREETLPAVTTLIFPDPDVRRSIPSPVEPVALTVTPAPVPRLIFPPALVRLIASPPIELMIDVAAGAGVVPPPPGLACGDAEVWTMTGGVTAGAAV